MNINDPSILSTLTLNIKTKNMNFVEEAQTITIIYKIYYKVMTTQLNPRVVCQSKMKHYYYNTISIILKPLFLKN